jgi:hypothetical protein
MVMCMPMMSDRSPLVLDVEPGANQCGESHSPGRVIARHRDIIHIEGSHGEDAVCLKNVDAWVRHYVKVEGPIRNDYTR